ncbi:MAG: UDP-N-acetylglucosamine--N-acetylmuramyl-(pentapeptide) pyrophosphoryl-undecaprenol N-acetylglucosamine transferase [Anaerolineae bacterium]|nr:UDP-N-acetylglucosamine--N-acetylmuramyl-(pentapeptide) pyrophosphoryl-undecaprenol N-acetylglucosamine transferase [Anaerolineae bacterium]
MYPAIAAAEALFIRQPNAKLMFVGSVGGFERPLLDEASLSFENYDEVRAGPLHGVSPLTMLGSIVQLIIGTLQALGLILRRKPDVILLTGGWVGLPVALSGWLLRVPSLIYLPDIEPGLAIKILRHFATRVAVTADESKQYFRAGQAVVTGYPTRDSLKQATRAAAIEHFGLDPARKTVLVWGGSRGARTINNALLDALPELLAFGVQIIHVTGTLDWGDLQKRAEDLGMGRVEAFRHYHPYAYLHDDVGLALAAADLTVSRAGASVLGEYPLFGLPSILVPYPYAWRYQKVNAEYLSERGAAIFMRDEDMARDLLPTIQALLTGNRLAEMQTHAAALSVPEGAGNVAQQLIELAG